MFCHHGQGERWPKHSREVLLLVSVEIVTETVQRMKQHSHIVTAQQRHTLRGPNVFLWCTHSSESVYSFYSCLTCLKCLENTQERAHVYTVLKPLDLHASLEQHLLLPTQETSIQGLMAQTWADTTLQPDMN